MVRHSSSLVHERQRFSRQRYAPHGWRRGSGRPVSGEMGVGSQATPWFPLLSPPTLVQAPRSQNPFGHSPSVLQAGPAAELSTSVLHAGSAEAPSVLQIGAVEELPQACQISKQQRIRLDLGVWSNRTAPQSHPAESPPGPPR